MLSSRITNQIRIFTIVILSYVSASCGDGSGPSSVQAEKCPASGAVSFDSVSYPESASSAVISITDTCIGRKEAVVNVDNGIDTISVDLDVVDGEGASPIKFGVTDDASNTIAIKEGDVLTVKYSDANTVERTDTADIAASTALSTLGVYSETNTNPELVYAEIPGMSAVTDRFSQTVTALEGGFSLQADFALPSSGNENGFAFTFFGLVNPNFEADAALLGSVDCFAGFLPNGCTGWSAFEFVNTVNTAGPNSGPVSHDVGGAQSLGMFGPFSFDTSSGAYQADDTVVAGQSYTATAYAMNWNGDNLGATNLGIMQLSFWSAAGGQDGGGTQIGPAFEIKVDSTDDGTNIYLPPQDGADISDWTELTITQTAPAGAVSAEIFLLHIQLGNTPAEQEGSIYWDDVSLAGVKDLSGTGEDISTYETLQFGINTTTASGLMDLEVKMEDNTGATASVFLSNYTSAPGAVAGWDVYDIPLSDFTGIDKTTMISLGFDNASSTVTGSTAVAPTLLAATLYFDDIFFAKADATALTGLLLDSAVEGVTFLSATQSGITNDLGEFLYLDGEMVTFSVGDIVLGTVPGAPIITSLELTGSVDPTNQAATNQLVFLQSIDDDQNPANGITISAATQAAAVGQTLDFTIDSAAFTTAVTTVVNTISPGNAIVSETDAVDNFYQTFPPTGSTVNTTINVSSASVVADGLSSSTITVQAKDSSDNNITVSAGVVVLSVTGSATLSAVTDNNDGTYTATVTNTVAEAITISGSISGNNITDTAVVTFTPSSVLGTLGVYSETHTNPVLVYSTIIDAADFGGNDTTPNETSTAVSPLDGNFVLQALFLNSSKTYGGIIFDFSLTGGGGGTNLLTNESFESPDASGGDVTGAGAPWISFNSNFTSSNLFGPPAFFVNPAAHGGTQVLKQFGTDAGSYQDLAASPGETWTASAWAQSWAGDPNNNTGLMQIFFRDATTNLCDPGGFNACSQAVFDTSQPIDTWVQLITSAVAPAGTTTVRIQLILVPDASTPTGGALFWDDASLTTTVPTVTGGDISAYEKLKFGIDTSGISTFADLKVQLEDGTVTPGVFLSSYTPVVSGNWELYEIPLSDFTGLDKSNLTKMGFWNASSVAGAEAPLVFGPLYFDDIYFEKGIPIVPVLTGVLLDSPVEGVTFQTATQSGVTNVAGEFQYQAGEIVTFSVGSIVLGAVQGADIITPVELTGSFDPTDQAATNLLVFLQSIDDDQNHSNGLTISAATQAAAVGQTLDFSLDSAAFTTAVTTVVNNITEPDNAVVSETTALDNFYLTYVDLGGTNTFSWLFPGYPQVGEPGYTFIWSDEFNDGTSPDVGNWNIETGYGDNGWGNNEWQLYTTSPDNVRVESGNLVITADCPTAPACGVRNDTITSGRINSLNKFEFKYGKVQARIKPPVGTGAWPAFWMLGANFPVVGWPFSGEIDVMEMHNAFSNEFTTHFTMHWCDDSKQNPATPGICYPENEGWTFDSQFRTFAESLGNDFHIFEAEWDSGQMIGKIDGITYFTKTIDPVNMDEFLKEFFVVLNVAMGGTLGSNSQPPSGSETWPQTMLVDYVRVYQLIGGDGTSTIGGGSTPGPNLLTNESFESPDASAGDVPGAGAPWGSFNSNFTSSNLFGPPAFFVNPDAHGGTQVLKQFGTDAGSFQDLAASPGETWTASAWAQSWAGDPNNNTGLMQIFFRDATTNLCDPGGFNACSQAVFDTSQPIDTWVQLITSAVAPAGTTTVRIQLILVPDANTPTGGALFWDDASLSITN